MTETAATYEAPAHGWTRIDRLAKADGARDRVESLWLNPATASRMQQRLFA